jgi:predicted nucleic acid-binding protein
MFLLCAINGRASHLVSYDNHLRSLRSFYERELQICEPLEFLEECRVVNLG